MKKILNNLKQIRWERNLSTRDLEKICGVSHSMISKIENGQTYPTQVVMLLICGGLKLRMEDVFIIDPKQLEN